MFLRYAAAASRMEVAKYHSGHLRKTTLRRVFPLNLRSWRTSVVGVAARERLVSELGRSARAREDVAVACLQCIYRKARK